MRYVFLMAMVLHANAAMACEVQSDVQAGDNSTTVKMRDCADQVVPEAMPHKELPAIPSVGVQVTPGAPPPSAAPETSITVNPQPKAEPARQVRPKVLHNYKAVAKRLHRHHAQEPGKSQMFWWHTRK